MAGYRQRVVRADGRNVTIAQRRAHLSYCFSGCCCGRTERGYAEVPVDTWKDEWLRRRMRNTVHLTKAGCLGPCVLANVASLVFDGRSVWFHSVNSPWQVRLIFDYIEAMLTADRFLAPPEELVEYVFNFYDWDLRPRDAATPAAAQPSFVRGAVAFLSHADTDLLTVLRCQEELPADLKIFAYSLNALRSDEQMEALLSGALAAVSVVVLRLHGPAECVPGFDRLRACCNARGQRLALISGTGELNPEFLSTGDAPADVVRTATAYLGFGGTRNVSQCFRFLSDRLLLTAFGYEDPLPMPEHGIYMPDVENPDFAIWTERADARRPTAAVLFYRAHLLSGNTGFVDTLVESIELKGMNALCVFTSSLKALDDGVPAAFRLLMNRVDVAICTLSFAAGDNESPVFAQLGVPVIQAIASGMPRGSWEVSRRGLNPLDTAINVAIPEFDGRIISAPLSFKERAAAVQEADRTELYMAHEERAVRIAGMAEKLARLRRMPNSQKRIAFVLTNSAAKASQIGNAVGLDAPASLLHLLRAMKSRRYSVAALPDSSDALMRDLISRGTYDEICPLDPARALHFPRTAYRHVFGAFPENARRRMSDYWGEPSDCGYTLRSTKPKTDKKLLATSAGRIEALDYEPWSDATDYRFAAMELGNTIVALQPPRGYGLDPGAVYHTPDLPPTHHYAAFYRWLTMPRNEGGWGADAIVHVGKHGTLEWLPGKGVGLSADCFPDVLLGDTPLVYPFILNDPGEGSQAKRRAHAVIVDHLTPPMTSADTWGPLAELNQLINEYYSVEKLDPSRLPLLQQQIWELIQRTNLRADLDLRTMLARDHSDHRHDWDDELTPEGVPVSLAEMSGSDVAHLIEDIDGYLCELGTAQIRDGLHTLGELRSLPDMLRSLTRLANAGGPSLHDAIASHWGFEFADLIETPGARLESPVVLRDAQRHTNADVIEAIEDSARDLYVMLEEVGFQPQPINGVAEAVLGGSSSGIRRALEFACRDLVPKLELVSNEIEHILNALEGRFVPPGPAGAPTRGMAHILPSGRNFYAIDPRSVPSEAAWRVGRQLAREAIERYRAEEGGYPEMIGLSAWGTSQMRTHGDDIAEALALLGVEPEWSPQSRRVAGVKLIPLETLGRPRIDVTLRISGFFRDAFPHLIDLFDDAVTLVVHQDESPEWNYPRRHYLRDLAKNSAASPEESEAAARYRVFGAKPGAYGAGIQQLIETQYWKSDEDLAQVFVEWGGYAYARDAAGVDARGTYRERLKDVRVAIHNQDNREHDIFDSDDYYQFHGGMIATVRALTGLQPKAYFGDSSRPDASRVRDLREEALRVYRSRVINPKWLTSIRRHGYKGGLELAATVDYVFAFDATAHIAPDFVYEGLAENYALSPETRAFLEQSNPWALNVIAERLLEAARRELWEKPRPEMLDALRGVLLGTEALMEAAGESRRVEV